MVFSIFSSFGNTFTSIESNIVLNNINTSFNSWAPFTISNNSQLSSFASSGAGTENSSYILQNYVITGSNSSEIGITIENTTAYFVLQNISITNCGVGIRFVNVIKGSIINSHLKSTLNFILFWQEIFL